MSHGPTRPMPRWSAGGQPGAPASIAGLPSSSSRVWVGPPFEASGPSRGLAVMSTPQLPSLSRLRTLEPPCEASVPPVQSRGTLRAMIVSMAFTAPAPRLIPPAPLSEIVTLVSVSVRADS